MAVPSTTLSRLAVTAGLMAMALYFTCPSAGLKNCLYPMIGVASAVATVVGVRRPKPHEVWGWQSLAVANLCFVLGDGALDLYHSLSHRYPSSPSLADGLYLAGYPLLFIAVWRFLKQSAGAGGRAARLDSAIVAIGALARCWHTLMGSYAHDPGLAVAARVTAMAYPSWMWRSGGSRLSCW